MKLAGKKALITGGNSGIGLQQPDFSLRRARRSPLPVATRRRSMRRLQNSEQMRVATALMSPLLKTASGSLQPWPKISGNSTLSSPMPASLGGRLPVQLTRPFFKT